MQIVVFIAVLFSIHNWIVLPFLGISNEVPVLYQHLLLGGISLLIFLVTDFVSKNFFSIVGFVVLGFLLLKMIFLAIFINEYSLEITEEPMIKYVLLGVYFAYLLFLLAKIVPLINIDLPKKDSDIK